MIGHGHGGKVQLLRPGHQPVKAAGSVEQGELGVKVEMGEVGGHRAGNYANQSVRQQAPGRVVWKPAEPSQVPTHAENAGDTGLGYGPDSIGRTAFGQKTPFRQ
jgi:hypothetical protein